MKYSDKSLTSSPLIPIFTVRLPREDVGDEESLDTEVLVVAPDVEVADEEREDDPVDLVEVVEE